MIKATLEIGTERLDVTFSMFDEREGAIFSIDGTRLVHTAESAVDDFAALRPDDGSLMPITITYRKLTSGLGWAVGTLFFVRCADPPSADKG